jgi:alpha-L-rhamnosidase
MVKITCVRFKRHEKNAIGIGESEPPISWSFEGTEKDWSQASYELEMRLMNGKIEQTLICSSNSLLVPWGGEPLLASEVAEFRVRVTGNSGGTTDCRDWSSKKEDWKCSLTEPADAYATGPPHRPVIFQREVNLDNAVRFARLYITAYGVYEAQINSNKMGDHILVPGWTSYSHRLPYQKFDVSGSLVVGNNAIEVGVAEGWYCGKLGWHDGRKNICGNCIGLIAILVLAEEGGEKIICETRQRMEMDTQSSDLGGAL